MTRRPSANRSAARDRREPVLGRRRLLGGLTGAGLAALAGCTSGGDGGRSGTDRRPDTDENGRTWWTTMYGDAATLPLGRPSGRLGSFAFDVGFVRDPETGDPEYVLAESFEETETSVSITLREGLEWSNGEPLTAEDVGRWVLMVRAGSSGMTPVPEIRDGTVTPRSTWEAITAVEWDERTVTVIGEFAFVESPLFVLNTYLGSRPGTYYEVLWSAFEAAYDDDPWESEESQTRVNDVVESAIWDVTGRNGLEMDILLEDEYSGDSETTEAAFSGLWYPYRRRDGHLHFRVNETHPFADRVQYDEVVWTFVDGPQEPLSNVRAGVVDGAMGADVTEDILEDLPSELTAIPGPASGVTVLTLNHAVRHFWERDVRAALQYAIDRDRLLEAADPATTEAVSVPGADLQPDRWVPEELRETLRPYRYDPDRAADLLEGVGFSRDGDTWLTPDGEVLEVEVFTTIDDSSVERAVASELRRFGVEADSYAVENTTYQERLQHGYFAATCEERSSPSAAGIRRTRTADVVRRPPYRESAPESAYLGAEITRRDDRDDGLEWVSDPEGPIASGHLAFDDVEALRSITVDAPPLGDPDGELREWPHLYHATMVDAASDPEERLEHARRCTWIYNYQVPELELTIERSQIVHRTEGWTLPDADDPVWSRPEVGLHPGGLWAALGHGSIDSDGDSGADADADATHGATLE